MEKLILAIDIQNEYISEGRPFFIPGIKASLEKIKTIFSVARENGTPIWHMQHKQKGSVFNETSELANFIKDFEPLADEKFFVKDMYSCFSSKDFLVALTEFKPEEIIIVGYGSSMCCLCTIIDGIHRGFQFVMIDDATAAKNTDHAESKIMHESAINILKQYARVINSDELIINSILNARKNNDK